VFEEAYRKLYGVNPSHVPVELVTWRLTARGPTVSSGSASALAQTPGKPRSRRAVPLWPEHGEVDVYARRHLSAGQVIAGPAIIEERETTTAIPPGWTAEIDQYGCIVARRGEDQ
jgi:N-methylhydantoinase A